MASPPQHQSTGYSLPNMLDLDPLVRKVQDVQDVRQKMQQLQERKNNEALQGSSQLNELDPTKSKVQKLQTDIQQLEDKMKQLAETRVQLLNESTDCLDQCQSRWISRLKEWRWEQQKAAIGHPFDDDLNPLQSWCEQLFEVNKNLREELQLVGEPMPELQDRLEKLLKVLVQSSLVVDKQPRQVIKTSSRISTSVRLLLGEKVMSVMLEVKIINEQQARDLDSVHSDDAGKLVNNTAILDSDTASRSTRATFRNMCIKKIKRPDRRGSKLVTEQKYALLFSTEIFTPDCDTRFKIQIISLPVVVISSSIQGSRAWATIIWDCAFSEADRVPFMVPKQVSWRMLFSTLNSKFTAEVQTQRSLDQHNQQRLAQKIFNKPDCADDFSDMMVSWAQFNKELLPGQLFTFWQWFEGVMELTKTHLKTYWSEGLIFGVIGKQKLHQILRDSPAGTFLLRFSDSEIGGITISYVSATEKGELKIQSIQPFTKRNLESRSLGDRIHDISHITHLYPDIPKHEVFKRFYSEPQTSRCGYIPVSLQTRINNTEDERPAGFHSVERMKPITIIESGSLLMDPAIPEDLSGYSPLSVSGCPQPVAMDPSFQSSSYYEAFPYSILTPFDLHDDMLKQPLTATEMIKNQSSAADGTAGLSQDNTSEMELHATAGLSTLQLSTSDDDDDSDSAAFYDRVKEWDVLSASTSSTDSEPFLCGFAPNKKYKYNLHSIFNPGYNDAYELSSAASESASGAESDAMMEMETTLTALMYSATNTQPTHCDVQIPYSDPGWSERDSSCLSRSHSVPSLSQTTSPKTFTRSQSLPELLLKSSFVDFTPEISVDEDDETYRFQCSCPGLYQCSVTGLVFHMEAEGDVVYRTVPWDRRLLAQHNKQPAGPLFDIKCLQQSVCQLHLPHCEIRSTGGCEFLSVAHVNDEGIEFIVPQKITETHVIINITGFSGFGNVKDKDSPPDPVRALVLLFYRPPADPDIKSFLRVLLIPRNAVIRDVLRTRKKLVGDEIFIETSPHCKLCPNQEYTLSTCPEDDSVLVQPTEAEFDEESYVTYYSSFEVIFKTLIANIKLLLRGTNSSNIVWAREVCFPSTGVRRSCRQSSSSEKLFYIRSSFIDGISGPVLKSLLDKLFEKTVITDPEREEAMEKPNHSDKARFVIDTVRKKGEAASSEMIEFLCELDPFLCKHLGLI